MAIRRRAQQQQPQQALPCAAAPLISLSLAFVLLFLLAAAPAPAFATGLGRDVTGDGIPGILQCQAASDRIGDDALLLKLASCASGTNGACCSDARSLLQLGGGGELAGCTCYELALDQTLQRVEQNALAKNFGVTRDTVMTILKDCKIRYAGGSGDNACPSKHQKKHDAGAGGKSSNSNSNNNKHSMEWMAEHHQHKKDMMGGAGGGRRRLFSLGAFAAAA